MDNRIIASINRKIKTFFFHMMISETCNAKIFSFYITLCKRKKKFKLERVWMKRKRGGRSIKKKSETETDFAFSLSLSLSPFAF